MTCCPPWLAWYTNNTRLYFCDVFLHIQWEQWYNEEVLIFGFKDKILDLWFEKNYANMDLYMDVINDLFCFFFFFFKFLKWVGWWFCTRGFIKIWLEVRGGIKKKGPPYNLVTCWDLFFKYGKFRLFFLIMWWLGPIFLKKNPFVRSNFFKGVQESCHIVTIFCLLKVVPFYHVKTHLWMIMMKSKIVVV
jgi:hypothetical protein